MSTRLHLNYWLLRLGVVVALESAAMAQSSSLVSAAQLAHAVPRKALALLKQAADRPYDPGVHAILRKNLSDPALAPFALKALGIAHLNTANYEAAARELHAAAQQLPWDMELAGLESYALYSAGQTEKSKELAARVLLSDARDPSANLVLGLASLETATDMEILRGDEFLNLTRKRLRRAARFFPGAHLVMWELFSLAGRPTEARREMEAFDDLRRLLTPAHQSQLDAWIETRRALHR